MWRGNLDLTTLVSFFLKEEFRENPPGRLKSVLAVGSVSD